MALINNKNPERRHIAQIISIRHCFQDFKSGELNREDFIDAMDILYKVWLGSLSSKEEAFRHKCDREFKDLLEKNKKIKNQIQNFKETFNAEY